MHKVSQFNKEINVWDIAHIDNVSIYSMTSNTVAEKKYKKIFAKDCKYDYSGRISYINEDKINWRLIDVFGNLCLCLQGSKPL